jgi:general stress protein 26
MKIEPQSTPDRIRLGDLIADMPVAMLTSVGDDGALVSCPMEALEMDADGALWFFTDLRSDLAERLRVVNLSFADDVCATYVSISGRGEIAKDPMHIERLWTRFGPRRFSRGPALASSGAAQGGGGEGRVLGMRRTAGPSACWRSPPRPLPARRSAAAITMVLTDLSASHSTGAASYR